MNNNVFELTEIGRDELVKELEYLKNTARPENVEAIKEARAQGDLSENADYDAAREEQARIEGRIVEIENILKYAKIIKTTASEVVGTGKIVAIEFIDFGTTEEYAIVGTIEADPLNGKISNDSPVGKAILGLRVNDEATFRSETGKEVSVKIVSIR